MKRFKWGTVLLGCLLTSILCLAQEAAPKPAPAAKPTMKLILPDEVKNGPVPPELVSGTPSVETLGTLEVAVLAGDPSKTGTYTMLLHCSDGYKIAPHWHPTDQNATVLKGEFGLGMGSRWNADTLQAMPVDSFVNIPHGMRHFGVCKGDTVVEVHGIGPFMINFVAAKPAAPSKKARAKKTTGM